jgi:hypothetical protein
LADPAGKKFSARWLANLPGFGPIAPLCDEGNYAPAREIDASKKWDQPKKYYKAFPNTALGDTGAPAERLLRQFFRRPSKNSHTPAA